MVREVRISVNGRPTRYLEAGAGWPLVLLHAFPLNADMWRPQLERVPAGWRMIAPDLRGFAAGASSPADAQEPRVPSPESRRDAIDRPPTMDDFADDVDALMTALEID